MIFKILKAETEYFIWFLLLAIALPILFSLFTIGDVQLFQNTYFLNKYFWSVLIGLGLYGIVFAIWGFRKKEQRERVHALLPLANTSRSIARLIFGTTPFLIIGLYIELHRDFVSSIQEVFINRINGQLGMMFIALAGIDLMISVWNSLGTKNHTRKIFNSTIVGMIILLLSILMIYAVTTGLIKPLSFGQEEIYFFIWAIILSLISSIIFIKRKIYLD